MADQPSHVFTVGQFLRALASAAVLARRGSIEPTSDSVTDFARIIATEAGIDPAAMDGTVGVSVDTAGERLTLIAPINVAPADATLIATQTFDVSTLEGMRRFGDACSKILKRS